MNKYTAQLSHESDSQEQPECPFPPVNAAQAEQWKQFVPPALQECPQWIVWLAVPTGEKWKKEPYRAKPGRGLGKRCSPTKPDNFTTFSQAVKVACEGHNGIQFHGIGFCLTEQDDFVGIDIDRCLDFDNTLEEVAEDILDSFQSYSEVSPSGTGIRIFVRANWKGTGRKDTHTGIECYSKERFLTVTGDARLDYKELRDANEALTPFLERYLPRDETKKPRPFKKPSLCPEQTLGIMAPLTADDKRILERAMKARKGVGEKVKRLWEGDISAAKKNPTDADDHSRADSHLVYYLAYWNHGNEHSERVEQLDRMFRHSKLYRQKWDRVGWQTIEDAISRQQGPTQPHRNDLKRVANQERTGEVKEPQQPRGRRERTRRRKAETSPALTTETLAKVPAKRGRREVDTGNLIHQMRAKNRWLSFGDIHALAPTMNERTLRRHLKKWSELGILEMTPNARIATLYYAASQMTLGEV